MHVICTTCLEFVPLLIPNSLIAREGIDHKQRTRLRDFDLQNPGKMEDETTELDTYDEWEEPEAADESEEPETDDESEESFSQPKLVALMLNASSKKLRSLEEERYLAQYLRCAYLDYGDSHSLLVELQSMVADKGKLNEAAYGMLRDLANAQLSIGGSAFMVSPIEPNEYRAYLDGLVELADAYGVPLTVIEVKGEPVEDEPDVKIALNDIPHLILPIGDPKRDSHKHAPAAISFDYPCRSFVYYFVSMSEFFLNSSASLSDSAKFRHFSHRHPLQLNMSDDGSEVKTDHNCSACMAPVTGLPYYSCLSCGFFLHEQCAELPQHMDSPVHSHPLRLVIASWEKSGSRLFNYLNFSERNPEFKIKCIVCDSEEQLPFYGCFHCYDLFIHHKCLCSLQHVIEHRLHPHPLMMETMKTDPFGHDYHCYACGGEGDIISYSCQECSFDFHLKCALSLPPSVRHKFHRDHPLILSMPPKDETNEYYCEVCAERRHPDYWIYLCARCEYEAHPHCVLEGIPRYSFEEEQEA